MKTSTKSQVKGTVHVGGYEIQVTNPEKPLWPAAGVTKLIYLQKLLALSPYLLTYCRNRYLTTIRFPHGISDKSFYQKNAPQPTPDFVKTAELNGINYVVLDSVPTLLWLGNLACLEFHPSFHYIGDESPAEWILDIDPSVDEEPRLMEAVKLIGEVLDSLNIASVPKTSGASGVQIFIPIQPRYSFSQLRKIGEFIARYLVQKHPRLFTIERLKKNRGTLIYIDYLQHWPGKTLSAPYTPRAREHATVSTPLLWEEVARNCDIKAYNLLTIEERLAKYGDLITRVPPQNLDHVLHFIP
ncbi:non-homologous end-joining DNA ligase [Paenibacillus senegalensis]|uniref:non-homologous end-joining DNA ligase n=1 Tax=Paenibacillus senegalensis TaxID=1465766 RepID=UPI000288D39A|nr:non-homologous end-joining DNA ligase [Paenibacillus senegalensis]